MPSTALTNGHAKGGDAADKSSRTRRMAALATPTALAKAATVDIGGALNLTLADLFALYVKTKNFHWHVSGPHFRDYHLLLDEQAEQIFDTTDAVAERVRKIGGTTLRSIGHIARLSRLREAHGLCEEHGDVATASLLEVWIDEAERRVWFLFEAGRSGEEASR